MSRFKNQYQLSKHRFYELKHFCLQYNDWQKLYFSREGFPRNVSDPPSDTTSRDGILRADLSYRMQIIEDSCMETSRIYSKVILRMVTEFSTAPGDEYLKQLYYKFFWVLDKKRN